MTQDKILCDIGFIGLGVMGKNLVLNLADNAFNIAVFDLSAEKVQAVIAQDELENTTDTARIYGCSSYTELLSQLNSRQQNWRKAICHATMQGVPIGALSSSLAYYDSIRCQTLPANLLQGQRDFFGAHTFERTDKPEGKKYHVEWSTAVRKTILIDS